MIYHIYHLGGTLVLMTTIPHLENQNKIWRKSKSLKDRQSFIKHRNHYRKLIIKTKQEYYYKTIDTNKNNIKKTTQFI